MSDFPQHATYVNPALTALKAGRAITDDGTNTKLINLTNQAATQRVYFKGITTAPCAAGGIPTLAVGGADEVPFVASGTVARGDQLAAKYHVSDTDVQGTLMKIGTQLTGDVVVAICTHPATDGNTGYCRLVGHPTL